MSQTDTGSDHSGVPVGQGEGKPPFAGGQGFGNHVGNIGDPGGIAGKLIVRNGQGGRWSVLGRQYNGQLAKPSRLEYAGSQAVVAGLEKSQGIRHGFQREFFAIA
ncbi:hypothetical protein [Methylobacter luteus]|uniref:hypothetical protein n=1 Tax=Methylobacter luteus TaxID=415 RepID=UPI0012DF96CD